MQACDVARWRRAERIRLAALREELGQSGGRRSAPAIATHLGAVLAAHGAQAGAVVAGYWPIRREPDLRRLLSRLHKAGVTVALPVVETLAAPLVFRRWTPHMRMERGHWNIPVPPARRRGWSPVSCSRPASAGTGGASGWAGAGLLLTARSRHLPRDPSPSAWRSPPRGFPTIYPQPHDVPMDAIVTEDGLAAEKDPYRMTATTAERMRTWTGPALLTYGFRPFFLGAAIWAAFAMALWVPMLSGLVVPADRLRPGQPGTRTSSCSATSVLWSRASS